MPEPDRDIPEEMVEKGTASLVDGTNSVHQVRVNDEQMARWITEQVLSAALAGCAVVQLPEPAGQVDILPTQYDVSILPRDDINRSAWTVTVAYRGADRYAVLNGPFCLSRSTGDWDYESRPSDREDDWLDDHRFTRDEALQLAVEHAPSIVTNGKSATEVLAWINDRASGSGVGDHHG